MKNVAAVVVTYNRLGELKKNLDMLLKQTYKMDAIFVVDNASTDDTAEYVNNLSVSHPTVQLVSLEKNAGGAGGFSYGLEYACKEGYKWVWLMDDDGRPSDELTLEKLMAVADKESNYSLINTNVLHDGSELSFRIGTPYFTLEEQRKNIPSGIIEDCACVFNGSLFGREVYEKIGTIRKEYFIRGDEVEYLMRCKNNGVKVLTVIDSLYYHPKTEYAHLSFLGKPFDYEVMAIWKQFFLIRNYVATCKSTATKAQAKNLYKGLSLIFLGMLVHEHSLKRVFYGLKAVFDGYRGVFKNHFRGVKK